MKKILTKKILTMRMITTRFIRRVKQHYHCTTNQISMGQKICRLKQGKICQIFIFIYRMDHKHNETDSYMLSTPVKRFVWT